MNLRKLNTVSFIILSTSILLLLEWLISDLLFSMLFPASSDISIFNENDTLISKVVLLFIIAPVIETFVFQKLPFLFLRKYLNNSVIIIISALLFSLAHIYSIRYVIFTFILGVFFAYFYYLRLNKKPYITIVIVHALYYIALFLTHL